MESFVDPDQLSPDKRLRELSSLLAVAFLRHWLKKAPRPEGRDGGPKGLATVDGGEKGLDVLRTSSEVCDGPQSEGESL